MLSNGYLLGTVYNVFNLDYIMSLNYIIIYFGKIWNSNVNWHVKILLFNIKYQMVNLKIWFDWSPINS